MDAKLLDILVCPLCKGPLLYKKSENELICKADRLAFPIKDGIPVMLEDEARKISSRSGNQLSPSMTGCNPDLRGPAFL